MIVFGLAGKVGRHQAKSQTTRVTLFILDKVLQLLLYGGLTINNIHQTNPHARNRKTFMVKTFFGDIFSEISQFNEIQSQREHHSGGPGSRHL